MRLRALPRSTRLMFGLGVAFIVVGALLISPLQGAFADEDAGSPAPVAVPGSSDLPSDPADPVLTSQQRELALAIARDAPAVRAVLDEVGSYSAVVFPWTTLSRHDRLLGAGVEITWDTPLPLTGTWPTLVYDETEALDPPYLTASALVSAVNVTGIHASIDLSGRRVVGVHALPGSRIVSYKIDPAFRDTRPPQPQASR